MKPGFYPSAEIPMATYLADPCPVPSLSSGAAHKMVTRSPMHVWAEHPRLGAAESDDSNASDIGTIAHDLLLGGEGRICVIDPNDYRSKPTKDNPDGSVPVGWTNTAIRAARDQARANGLTPILAGAMWGARQMETAARDFLSHSELAGVLADGEGEVTMLWQEGETWFRARPDWVNHQKKIMLHLKTSEASAEPASFIRGVMRSMGYAMSLAFYRRGFEALSGQTDWLHVILVIEQRAPYGCSLISLDPAAWAIADSKVERALAMWRNCIRLNVWPGYPRSVAYATPSAWELAEEEGAR